MKTHSCFFFALFVIALTACRPSHEDTYTPTPYELPQPLFFPTKNNIPADNPMTEEGVALGELLFNSECGMRNAEFGITSCASCHHKEYSYEFGPVPTLEDMVYAAYTDPSEINADTSEVVRRLQQSATYPELFKKAFGTDEISFILVEKAIAQYVRSLVFANSKFDRYLRGEEQLSQDELNGYLLFTTETGADCFHCHGGGANALFTTHQSYNNGLDTENHGEFKAPTLRNIALTAPYMHDGRFRTLDEVIDFYSEGVQYSEQISPLMHHVMQGGVQLTPEEKKQLKAFLNTLTDDLP